MEKKSGKAKIQKINNLLPNWAFPVMTALIGIGILFYYYSHQGPIVTLITTNAEGIESNKTTIRSRNVDIGIVESTTLTDDLTHVEVKARIHNNMKKALRDDSLFWVVKPQIGRKGISGLGTLLSGAYIELQPGTKGIQKKQYQILESPPLATPEAKGIHVILNSDKAGQLSPGDPVLFRGYRVGSVESSTFDPQNRIVKYQLFINAPNDRLVTSNVRFWKDNGIAVNFVSTGIHVEIGSLATLFGNGNSVSFDVLSGKDFGQLVTEKTSFKLYDDQLSTQDSIYTNHIDYLMFFKDSIRGLYPGAPVEFRGVRLGTVNKVPFFMSGLEKIVDNNYSIPVLVRVEPERLMNLINNRQNIDTYIDKFIEYGLCGSLKMSNLITGTLYIDIDFYPKIPKIVKINKFKGYKIIPTVSNNLAQIQQRIIEILDKIEKLPLNYILQRIDFTLNENREMVNIIKNILENINQLIINNSVKQIPKDIQKVLNEFSLGIHSLQPGSSTYSIMIRNMQRLDQVLRKLQLVLTTLNDKSNALIFKAKDKKNDLQPKRAQ